MNTSLHANLYYDFYVRAEEASHNDDGKDNYIVMEVFAEDGTITLFLSHRQFEMIKNVELTKEKTK